MVTGKISYDSVVLKKDTGVIRGLPIHTGLWCRTGFVTVAQVSYFERAGF